MQNPFESGHIKNYLLLYASIVVIMVLFFMATSLFIEAKEVDKKVFNTEVNQEIKILKESKEEISEDTPKRKFKLLDKAY